jgi:hypothetical protein
MRYSQFIFLSICVILSLAACNSSIPTIITVSTFPVLIATPATSLTVIPTISVPPSATLSADFQTSTPTPKLISTITPTFTNSKPAPTTTSTWNVQKKCLGVESQPLADRPKLSGMLILSGSNKTYVLNLDNGLMNLFPTSQGASVHMYSDDFAVSPDNQFAAYVENYFSSSGLKSRYLRLIDGDLYRYMMPAWIADWQWIIGWVDNQRLAIWLPKRVDGTVFILEPRSGSWKELPPSFPIQNDKYVYSAWYVWGQPLVYYDATMTKVVYPSNGNKIVLWDIQSQSELWSGRIEEYESSSNAIWSSDSRRVIISTTNENKQEGLVSIDLTTDKGVESTKIPLGSFINVEQFSLSQNNRYIAVWASPDEYGFERENLILVDMDKQETTDLCIKRGGYFYRPIWSPDGTQLLVAMDSKPGSTLVLIDISRNRAYKMDIHDVEPVGWLQSNR